MFPFIDEINLALSILNGKGISYVVGGAIRNYYFNQAIIDYDIATPLKTDEILSLFKDYDAKLYANKRTVLVKINNISIEITPFKGDDILSDLSLRDFTINAIAMSINGDIYDPFKGLDDIKNKVLRPVLKIEDVITYDPLRMLRAIRFINRYNLKFDNEFVSFFNDNASLLTRVNKNRFKKELDEIFIFDNPSKIIKEYKELFFVLFPHLRQCYNFDQRNRKWHHLDVFSHIMLVLDSTKKDLVVRYAALFHDIDKPVSFTLDEDGVGHFYGHFKLSSETAKENLLELGYSKIFAEKVAKLVYYHDNRFSFENDSIDNFIEIFGSDISEINNLFNLMQADIKGQNPDLLYRLDNLEKYRVVAIKIASIRNKIS